VEAPLSLLRICGGEWRQRECLGSGRHESYAKMAILLMIANRNIASFEGKSYNWSRKPNDIRRNAVRISSTKRRGSHTVDLNDEWKLFYSSVEPVKDETCEVACWIQTSTAIY